MTLHRLRLALTRLLSLAVSAVLVGCLLVFGLIALGPHVFGYRTATMLTGSMDPGITPGDVVVSLPKPADEVEVGDVISYHIPVEDHRVETHRVIEVIGNDDGTIAVRTQGDANAAADPWVATLDGDTVWEKKAVVPWIGNGIRALRSPFVQRHVFWGALALMLLVGLSMIWSRDDEQQEQTEQPVVVTILEPDQWSYTAALAALAEDLDADYALTYAGQWSDLLPRRIDRVHAAVRARDALTANDAVLSLKVSSASIGAVDLAETAALLEEAIADSAWELADDLLTGLPQLADRSRHDLQTCMAA
ncbi:MULTISPECIES: signal peptidase I [unclassified Nocardioides]|uniref:signal peptidase I n=1 Tax=unclassified Nocardioides TaxID=2615069 RepID=UPI0009E88DF8|nr:MULTISPECIES: signal peptidase I [unclassified Nocardioides]